MFKFKVMPDGRAPFEVITRSRDISLWERTIKGRNIKALEASASMMMFEELAHITARRHGLYEDNLASFRDTCDLEVEQLVEDDGDGLDPTQPGP